MVLVPRKIGADAVSRVLMGRPGRKRAVSSGANQKEVKETLQKGRHLGVAQPQRGKRKNLSTQVGSQSRSHETEEKDGMTRQKLMQCEAQQRGAEQRGAE